MQCLVALCFGFQPCLILRCCTALALLCTKFNLACADGSADAVAGGAVAGRKAVDFENLAFVQGNHLMTNKKCDLPQKSYRAAHKASHIVLICLKHLAFVISYVCAAVCVVLVCFETYYLWFQ